MSQKTSGLDLTLGPVSLVVTDLDPMIDFYVKGFGLKMRRTSNELVELLPTEKSEPMLVLRRDPKAEGPPVDAAGLYHYALLLPSRRKLASAYLSLGNAGIIFEGHADHVVSEALYLADPEGNGIEIYADRPRDKWKFDEDGRVEMATLPLDIDSLLKEMPGPAVEGLNAFDEGARVGHVHLKVTNLARSVTFYQQVLGMSVMKYYGSAAFLSVRGYHHHIGLNTWESLDGPLMKKDWSGLEYVTVNLKRASFDSVLANLSNSAVAYTQDSDRVFVADPDGIDLLIKPVP